MCGTALIVGANLLTILFAIRYKETIRCSRQFILSGLEDPLYSNMVEKQFDYVRLRNPNSGMT